jgi:hypothetical protein
MWNFEFLSSLCLSICQRLLSFNLSINESISQTSNQSNIQSVKHHPINQSINQSINQAINQYIFLLPFVSCLFLSSLFLCPSHYLSNVVWFLFSYYTLLLFLNWLFRSLLSHNSLWISQQYQMFINGYLLPADWWKIEMFYWVNGYNVLSYSSTTAFNLLPFSWLNGWLTDTFLNPLDSTIQSRFKNLHA